MPVKIEMRWRKMRLEQLGSRPYYSLVKAAKQLLKMDKSPVQAAILQKAINNSKVARAVMAPAE
jgi:hypothetical protein